MSSFNYNNGNIFYLDQGKGKPVVLIHGFGLDKRQWDSQVEELIENGHRVITYDMRGFGESDLPNNEYSHEDDLNALLDHLHLENNLHIVGSSFGAVTAMEFASKHPERVKAMTLLAPSPGPAMADESSPFPQYRDLAQRGQFEKLMTEMLSHESMASLQGYPQALANTRMMVQDYLTKTNGWHFMNRDPEIKDKALTESMNRVSCPTQIMIGEKDYEFGKNAARYVSEQIDEASLVQVEDCGHLLNLENPNIVNEAILRFDEEQEGHEEDFPRISIASILL